MYEYVLRYRYAHLTIISKFSLIFANHVFHVSGLVLRSCVGPVIDQIRSGCAGSLFAEAAGTAADIPYTAYTLFSATLCFAHSLCPCLSTQLQPHYSNSSLCF